MERSVRLVRKAGLVCSRVSAAILVYAVAFCSGVYAQAQAPQPSETQAGVAKAKPVSLSAPGSAQRTLILTGKDLGVWEAIKFRGSSSARNFGVGIRSDEKVISAKLHISYAWSPALVEKTSQFKVFINEKLALIDPLAATQAQGVKREVVLNPEDFKSFNELSLRFIGKSSAACDSPSSPHLWLTVYPEMRLELVVVPNPNEADLRLLPAPFVDRYDGQAVTIPFVFSKGPSRETLRAAGIVSSWLGHHAGPRGLDVPVLLNRLPDSHAIVFLKGEESVEGFEVDRLSRSTGIKLMPNPINPAARILLVSGTNDADLVRAARALALTHGAFSGSEIRVDREIESEARLPYDAPAWVRTDRPVALGEIMRSDELVARGFFPSPIRVNYRLPPDLFTWRTSGVPIKLRYRATRLPFHYSSVLSVSSNDRFIDSININEEPDKKGVKNSVPTANPSVHETTIHIPPYAIKGREQLQFGFSFDIVKFLAECATLPPDNLIGAVDAESTIDFSQFPRFMVLPDLSHFMSLGFPYTRLADLAETAVVLPDRANADEVAVYLNLMGKFGESTGYPALRHQLVGASEVSRVANKDLIVIGSGNSQKLFTDWSEHLPMVMENGVRVLRESLVGLRPGYYWEQTPTDKQAEKPGSFTLVSNGDLVTVMGFESPLTAKRSVVFFYADQAGSLQRISRLLIEPERNMLVRGDFVVVDPERILHTRIAKPFTIGELPWRSKVKWFLSDHPIIVAVLALLAALILAAFMYRPLKFLVGQIRGRPKS